MQNFYDILGVPPTASTKEIRWAYRRLAFVCHPDRNPSDPSSDEILKLANEAYHTLVDPLTREKYDAAILGNQERSEEGLTSAMAYRGETFAGSTSLFGIGVKETALLSLTLLGAFPVIFLSDLFLPQVTFLTSLFEVWGVTLLAGGFSRASALRHGLSRIELGLAGLVGGLLTSTLLFHPQDEFLPFLAITKIALAAGVGGWLSGMIAARVSGRLVPKPLMVTLGVATLLGALMGAFTGGFASYLLSSGALNEYLINALSPGQTPSDYAAFLLGAIGGATGGSVLATTLCCKALTGDP